MIPKWQWAGIILAVAVLILFAIYSAPNSFAHLVLAGDCNRQPMPAACAMLGRRAAGARLPAGGW